MRNNKIRGKSNEKKWITEQTPSFDGHILGTEDYYVDFSKQMAGVINYHPKMGFFLPTDLGNPEEVEFLTASYISNMYWKHRPQGIPGSRL
ncbi:MAG: hypothetical protein EBY39_01860 [Flavobacteriia bacterium]|nr:hypothetical protein [Flavobacteriia bacterium]